MIRPESRRKAVLCVALALGVAARADAAYLVWDANPPEENVVAYEAQDNGAPLCTTGATQCTIPPESLGRHCYRVLAVNALGLKSDWSQELCVDWTPPRVPAALRLSLSQPSSAGSQ